MKIPRRFDALSLLWTGSVPVPVGTDYSGRRCTIHSKQTCRTSQRPPALTSTSVPDCRRDHSNCCDCCREEAQSCVIIAGYSRWPCCGRQYPVQWGAAVRQPPPRSSNNWCIEAGILVHFMPDEIDNAKKTARRCLYREVWQRRTGSKLSTKQPSAWCGTVLPGSRRIKFT